MQRLILTLSLALFGCSGPSARAETATASATTTPSLVCDAKSLLADLTPHRDAGYDELFPLDASLEPAYHFWRRVYGEWTNNQAILHLPDYKIKVDNNGVVTVYDGDSRYVIDYSNRAAAREARRKGHSEYWRMQRGQKDRLDGAFEFWQRHQDQFATAFENAGVPVEASALGFIESMFDVSAHSATGAIGVYQIQPWEGHKLGARMDAAYSDLKDPRRSAELAARKLSHDSRLLAAHAKALGVKEVPTTWPLALISYNQGVNSMRRAVEDLNTVAIHSVIDKHKGSQWGFAGRNFYPQFRLFADLVRTARKRGCRSSHPATEIKLVELDAFVALDDLGRCCGVARRVIEELNPGFTELALTGRARLPKGFMLAVPAGSAENFRKKLRAPQTAPPKHTGQMTFARYRLRRGENLTGVARKTGTTLFALLAENALTVEQANKVHPGKGLRIPTMRFAKLAAQVEAQKSKPKFFRLHRVRGGQSVRQIERKYGLAAGELKKWNDMSPGLSSGVQLSIPLY